MPVSLLAGVHTGTTSRDHSRTKLYHICVSEYSLIKYLCHGILHRIGRSTTQRYVLCLFCLLRQNLRRTGILKGTAELPNILNLIFVHYFSGRLTPKGWARVFFSLVNQSLGGDRYRARVSPLNDTKNNVMNARLLEVSL